MVVTVDAASPACYRYHETGHKAGDCPQNNDDQRGGTMVRVSGVEKKDMEGKIVIILKFPGATHVRNSGI